MHNVLTKNTKNLVISHVSYYKLPYIGNLSTEIKQKVIKYCKYYCKSTNIKIVFSPFKVGNLFSVKGSVPKYLRSFVVYRFTCPGCNASYIGETTHHLTTRIKEHLETHIFKHLNTNRKCKELCNAECFEIIDSATSSAKTIIKQTGKARKYFYNYLVTYCLTLFYLFYYCYCFCNHVGLILFKITFLICQCNL